MQNWQYNRRTIVRGELCTNSRKLRLHSPTVRRLFSFANYDEHLANTGERRRSSPEFALSLQQTGEPFPKNIFKLNLFGLRFRVRFKVGVMVMVTVMVTPTLNPLPNHNPDPNPNPVVEIKNFFWRTVRQFTANSARIRANSGELRLGSPSVCQVCSIVSEKK